MFKRIVLVLVESDDLVFLPNVSDCLEEYWESEKVKVLIIAASKTGGGHGRMLAYRDFLLSRNHTVSLIQIPGASFSEKLWYYYTRGLARLGGHEKRHMKKTADLMEKRINEGHYDVVIGVETVWSYVLTRDLGCLKIFSCESLEADELYFSKRFSDLNQVHSVREMELETIKKSDYVIFPWKTTENYVRRYIYDGDNFVTIKYGCYPKSKKASYFFPPAIVSLGNIGWYWSNRDLLSYLNRISPYVIDCYGDYRPPKKYGINYKGFAKSTEVVLNYQFGLNTVSKDAFRCNHHASRILTYLSFGLPVLSPDWLQFSHEVKGVLPFNEENFLNVVEDNSDRDQWEMLSKEAHEQARELDWNIVLQPLEKIICK